MGKWLIVVLVVLAAHFAASYLVPLDRPSQATFSGLLRWAWPWSDGDHGLLGTTHAGGEIPLVGFFIAVSAGALLLVAAASLVGLWVPASWWRVCVVAGASLSVIVLLGFLGPTKLVPLGVDVALLAAATGRWSVPGL